MVFRGVRFGYSEIFTVNRNGTGLTNVTNDSAANDHNPEWSPDGESIAFWSNRDGVEVVCHGPRRVERDSLDRQPLQDIGPVWSPDGKTIAFMSQCSGNFDIYLMAPDGTGQFALTRRPLRDGWASWQP